MVLNKEKVMKKWRSHLFSSKQERENQQVKADSKNRLSQIARNMSAGAANIFRSLRPHSAWGNQARCGYNTNKGGKPGHHSTKAHGTKKHG